VHQEVELAKVAVAVAEPQIQETVEAETPQEPEAMVLPQQFQDQVQLMPEAVEVPEVLDQDQVVVAAVEPEYLEQELQELQD